MKGKVGFFASVFMFLVFIRFSDDYELEIVGFYSCDRLGNFQDVFERGSKVYFNLTIRNLISDPKNVSVCITVYDGSNDPIGYKCFNTTLLPNSREYYMINITIPQWANVGKGAHAHANIFEGTIPIVPEKIDVFKITFWLFGDIDDNGVVDLGDIGKVILIYSGIITEPQWMIERADLNGNDVVDLGDLGKVILIYSGYL